MRTLQSMIFLPLMASVAATVASASQAALDSSLWHAAKAMSTVQQRQAGKKGSWLLNPSVEDLFEMYLGTPPQKIVLAFSLQIHGLYINPYKGCRLNDTGCQELYPRYDETVSDTYEVGYYNDDPAVGSVDEYYRDIFDTYRGYSGFKHSEQPQEQLFGVAPTIPDLFGSQVNSSSGIYGFGPHPVLGFQKTDLSIVDGFFDMYLPDSRRVVHIDFGRRNSRLEMVDFYGHIHPGWYSGYLQRVPIVQHEVKGEEQWGFFVKTHGVSFAANASTTPESCTSEEFTVLIENRIDSFLPLAVTNRIFDQLDAKKVSMPDWEAWTVDCSWLKSNATIDITFNKGASPISIMVWKMISTYGGDKTKCFLNLVPCFDDQIPVLGSDLLVSTYMLFDYDGPAIYMAPIDSCEKEFFKVTNPKDFLAPGCGVETGPGTSTSTNSNVWPTFSSKIIETLTSTITSCAPTVTDCSRGKEVVLTTTRVTSWHPSETATVLTPTTVGSCTSGGCRISETTTVSASCTTCGSGGPGVGAGTTGGNAAGSGSSNGTLPVGTGTAKPSSTVAALATNEHVSRCIIWFIGSFAVVFAI